MTEKHLPEEEFETVEKSAEDLSEVVIEQDEPVSGISTASLRQRTVYAGMWGPLEVAAVSIASFVFLGMCLFYILAVIPAQRELTAGQKQRNELDTELQSANEKWGDIRSTETRVAKLITSAEDFESRALKDASIGTTAIYQRINVLINAYGLRNTSGPDYVPLDTGDERRDGNKRGSSRKGRDKFKSLFPGIYITTTVEGAYPNVRKFIRDIESSSEFVAITSVELEPSEDEGKAAETATVETFDQNGRKTTQSFRKGRYRGNLVSLRIEMAAYFRRPAEQRLVTSVPDEKEGADAVSEGSSD